MADELLKLKDGRFFLDEEQSRVYGFILNNKPYVSYKWNEMAMADLFADCYRHNTLYCPNNKSWYVYNGTVWEQDTGAVLVNDRLKEFVRLLSIYSCELTANEVDINKYREFVSKLSDRRARDRIIKDAQSEAVIYIDDFDKNPYLINCENGTYDLESGTFHFHKADDFLTLKTNCVYMTENMDYKFSRWQEFINEITENDKEKAKYLQRALGYSLLGIANEECMFFAHGKTTRNGKGTLYNTIISILGDYATTADSGLICVRGGARDINAASPAVMALKGKRVVVMSETKERDVLDVRVIKNYTGNDYIPARALYGDVVNIKLQCTLWLMCNDLPQVNDKTLFSSDRAKVVEFTKHFSEQERDVTLKQKFLKKESKAVIFKWLLDGYKDYAKYGLADPQVIKDAITKYEEQDDLVKRFVEEYCEIDKESRTLNTTLYKAFDIWRKRADYEFYSKRQFYDNMDTKFEKKNLSGYLYYNGIKLKKQEEEESSSNNEETN